VGRFLGISIEILKEEWETNDGVRTCRITVRASLPNGTKRDATGACDSTEKPGKQATTHNIRSHADTRAKNRAILELVGFGEVSAEEILTDGEYENKNGLPQNTDRLTQGQSNEIYELSEQFGWAPAQLQANIQKKFKKALHELSREEAERVMRGLREKLEPKNKETAANGESAN
jgi:hypothetical protein